MGCVCLASSKDQLKVFNYFEDRLMLHSMDPEKVFESISNGAKNGRNQIRRKSVKSIWFCYGVRLCKHHDFYSNFTSKNSDLYYDSQLLSDLVISSSKLQVDLKARLLWMNYNSAYSTFIDSKTAKKIIADILLIALEIIPHYVEQLREQNRFIRNCSQKFLIVKPFILEWFFEKIMDGKKQISENEFLKAFQDKNVAILTNTYSLRKFALEYEEKLDSKGFALQDCGSKDDESEACSEGL